MNNSVYKLSAAIVFILLFFGTQFALCQENAPSKETIDIKVYKGMMPLVQFSYMDMMDFEEDYLEKQGEVLGKMVSMTPRKGIEDMNYFEISVLIIRSFSSQWDVAQQYITQMEGLLEEDFAWHTISGFVSADGTYQSLGGQGFVAWGDIVDESHPFHGITFSEEFMNHTLPGNLDLRVIFKYPTDFEDAEFMRRCFVITLSTLKVHTDEFDFYNNTDLSILKN